MNTVMGLAVVGLLCTTAASGICLAQAQLHRTQHAPTTKKWIQLNSAADLEHLRATNFNHYLRAPEDPRGGEPALPTRARAKLPGAFRRRLSRLSIPDVDDQQSAEKTAVVPPG